MQAMDMSSTPMPMPTGMAMATAAATGNATAPYTTTQLEEMAQQCRDDAFRSGLAGSELWANITITLRVCCDAIDAQLTHAQTSKSDSCNETNTNTNAHSSEEDTQPSRDDDNDGLSYSFAVPKGAPMSDVAADGLSNATLQVVDAQAALHALQLATSAVRVLRNACVKSPTNQDACRTHGLLRHAHELIMRCSQWVDVEEPELHSAIILLTQVALQFSVNGVTGCVANQQTVWALYFPDDFHKLLVECQEHRKVVAFTAALLLNAINGTDSADAASDGIVSRRADLVHARQLIITLLQRCLRRPAAAAPSMVTQPLVDEDPAFEWIALVFRILFQHGHIKEIYSAVGAHLLSRLWSRVTPEQLILLRMFALWTTSARRGGIAQAVDEKAALLLPVGTMPFVVSTFQYLISDEQDDRPEETDDARRVMWMQLEGDAKLLLLNVLGELTIEKSDNEEDRVAATQLLTSLLQELERTWRWRPLGKSTSSSTSTAPSSLHDMEPVGYRSALIRVIGNLCYRQRAHQDVVRTGGFLPLFLHHCNIDEHNPMLREWSLVALRHLCEDNAENQAYIAELRPQGLDPATTVAAQEALHSAGMKISLDEDGHVRMGRKQ